MAKPTLYQRIPSGSNYSWRTVKFHGNGNPKADPEAVSFGIRQTVDGKQRMEPCATLDDAMLRLKQLRVEHIAEKEGVRINRTQTAVTLEKTPMADAVKKYFENCAAMGKDVKSMRTYRYAVDSFVASCKQRFVEDVTKQDMIDFMAWMRKQPLPKRKHSNPERTMFNKVSHVAIFLKTFGKTCLLTKNEYPSFEEKLVSAHSGAELETLYAGCETSDDRFFLDFALTTGFRKGELQHAEYSDLNGNVIEVKRKPKYNNWHPKKHQCRKLTVPSSLADAIRERAKRYSCGLLFPSPEKCEPDGHIDRRLEDIAENAGAKFHTELHKLRKTTATRWAEANIPVHVIQKMLGHKSLTVTQRYLADIDMASERMSSAVEAAMFVPKAKAAKVGGSD
jgi:integrase